MEQTPLDLILHLNPFVIPSPRANSIGGDAATIDTNVAAGTCGNSGIASVSAPNATSIDTITGTQGKLSNQWAG